MGSVVTALLLALALLSGIGDVQARTAAPLTVFAASSLKEAVDDAASTYRKIHRTPVRIAYAGSPVLARQIAQGAPADVFISADEDWMDVLQRTGHIDARTRHDLLGNSLVLIAPARGGVHAPLPLTRPPLRQALGREGRLALALTASVPAGRYARAAFSSHGLWMTVAPRVVEVENVRMALQLVARGEAALGVVYATDAQAEPRVRVVARFPASSHPAIIYPVARIAASRHPEAAAFAAWLRSPAARVIFRRHGFVTL